MPTVRAVDVDVEVEVDVDFRAWIGPGLCCEKTQNRKDHQPTKHRETRCARQLC
jgi:hypothetical protein